MTRRDCEPVQGPRPESPSGLLYLMPQTPKQCLSESRIVFRRRWKNQPSNQTDFIPSDTLCWLILTEHQQLDIAVPPSSLLPFPSLPPSLPSFLPPILPSYFPSWITGSYGTSICNVQGTSIPFSIMAVPIYIESAS